MEYRSGQCAQYWLNFDEVFGKKEEDSSSEPADPLDDDLGGYGDEDEPVISGPGLKGKKGKKGKNDKGKGKGKNDEGKGKGESESKGQEEDDDDPRIGVDDEFMGDDGYGECGEDEVDEVERNIRIREVSKGKGKGDSSGETVGKGKKNGKRRTCRSSTRTDHQKEHIKIQTEDQALKRQKVQPASPITEPSSDHQGWRRLESKSTPGTFYYYHSQTGQCQMDPPEPWEKRESNSQPDVFYYFNLTTGESTIEKPEV